MTDRAQQHAIVRPGGGVVTFHDEDEDETYAYYFFSGDPVEPEDVDLFADGPYYIEERHDGASLSCDECRERGLGAFKSARGLPEV